MGFILLAGTTLGGLDLVRGNAVKVLSVLAWTLVTVPVFASADMIHWQFGSVMGLGNLVGSQLGVRWTVLKGNTWVRAFVTVAILALAVRLWFFG